MALTKAYGKDDMGKLLIEQLSVGMLPTNCYVLHLEDSTQAVVVDPGDQGAEIAEHLKGQGLKVSAVLLTHGHFDHIYGVKALKEATGAYVAAPEAERELLLDPAENLSLSFGHSVTLKADRYLADGEVFEEAGIRFMTIATPGHTAGSTSYFIDGEKPVLLSGDTLFCESIGRTDMPTSSMGAMMRSLRRLAMLPDNTSVLPGHMETTTIGDEKKYNPYLSGMDRGE